MFTDTYEERVKLAKEIITQFQQKGYEILKINTDPVSYNVKVTHKDNSYFEINIHSLIFFKAEYYSHDKGEISNYGIVDSLGDFKVFNKHLNAHKLNIRIYKDGEYNSHIIDTKNLPSDINQWIETLPLP